MKNVKLFDEFIADSINEATNIRIISNEEFYKNSGYRKYGDKWLGDFSPVTAKIGNIFYLLAPDISDVNLIQKIPLKDDEFIFRYETETSQISGFKPLIKVNVKTGIVYFLTQESMESGEFIEFEKRGVKTRFLNIKETELID